jgi:tRNA-specific 2-thiouridylase
VLEVKPASNEVIVGPREALDLAQLSGRRFSWAGQPPVNPEIPFDCHVQVRAHSDPVPASAVLIDGELVLTPKNPINGVSTGQTAVIYVGTRVLGQFTIDATVSAVPVGT